jgi:RHS repeat-associated protein
VVSGVTYHPFGGVKAYTLGNGQVYTRSIDLDGRIASYTLGPDLFIIGYDAASRISFISGGPAPLGPLTYEYDDLDRLTSTVAPGTTYAYTYDSVGNRLSRLAGVSVHNYTYSATSNRLASITPSSGPIRNFTFDANGSTTADGVNTYSYDARGRMVQAVSSLGATTYQVNALGQRIRKTNSLGDTLFHYDIQGKLVADGYPGGSVKRDYIYLNDIPVAVKPHAQQLNATADAYVRNGSWANTNFGTSSELRAKTSAASGEDYRSYIKFNTTGISSSSITRVKIHLKASAIGGNVTLAVHAVPNTAWSEGTINWANKPPTSASLGTLTIGVNPGSYELDVTQYVINEKAAGRHVVSFRLYPTSGNTAVMDSRENVSGPQLLVNTGQPLRYIFVDHLNTPRLLTNQLGQFVWRWDHQEPFGVNAADENPSGLGAFEFPQRFPGQYFDKETNLHYNYFRDYWPEGGRYIQSDPIGLDGGINTYAYAGDSPLIYSDAEGKSYGALAAGVLLGGIGGGLGAAATDGNILMGVAIGAATGGAVAVAPTVLPGLAGLGGIVTIRVVAGGLGNATSQFLNVRSNPCASFNYGSFFASAAGGYVSGLRAAGVAQAGLPTTGMGAFVQRAIAGISGTGTATTIGVIGTSLGNQANASGTSASGSSCCVPNACCPSQR